MRSPASINNAKSASSGNSLSGFTEQEMASDRKLGRLQTGVMDSFRSESWTASDRNQMLVRETNTDTERAPTLDNGHEADNGVLGGKPDCMR